MKQPGILLLYGIVLMSIICSTAATTTPEPEEDCLEFTKISYNEITLSWDRGCFSDDTSYKIELHGDISCPKKNVDCNTDPCEIGIKDMGCLSPPIQACSSATYIVTGNTNNKTMNRTTTAAPRFKSTDWKLENTHINMSTQTAYAAWGPPAKSGHIICATKANVTVTCPDHEGNTLINTTLVDDLDPAVQGTAQYQINGCAKAGNATLTVIYMSGVVLTETKNSTILKYTRSGARHVYPQNVVVSSGIAMIIGILLFNY